MMPLKPLATLLFAIPFLTAATPPEEGDPQLTQTLFDTSKSEVPYRIPAIARTNKGRILAVADYRINHSDIGFSNNDRYQINQVMRFSEDNGKTWSESLVIAEGDEDASEIYRVAYGDPSIVADRSSDEVLLHCVAGKTGYPYATRNNPQHAIFFRSYDGGLTWDKGEVLTEMIYGLYDDILTEGDPADGLFLTSGRIHQSRYIKVGKYHRLYLAHPLRRKDHDRTGTFVLYSDDFGRTWKSLGNPSKEIPSIAQDESKIEELPDGSVILSCREASGGRRFNVYTYTDPIKAEGYWGTEVMPSNMTAKEVNACNGAILTVPVVRKSDGKKLYLLLQSVPLNPKRVDVGFYYKEVNTPEDYITPDALGSGWKKALKVTSEDSCYSTMIMMENNRIGFLYEEHSNNDGYNIVFKSLSVEDITEGAYTLREGFLH